MSVEVHVVRNGEDHNKTQVFWIAVPKEYEKQSPHKYNIRELSARTFPRDIRQPEVRPSPFLYALTLTNLYC